MDFHGLNGLFAGVHKKGLQITRIVRYAHNKEVHGLHGLHRFKWSTDCTGYTDYTDFHGLNGLFAGVHKKGPQITRIVRYAHNKEVHGLHGLHRF
jgi:hypothetical protein